METADEIPLPRPNLWMPPSAHRAYIPIGPVDTLSQGFTYRSAIAEYVRNLLEEYIYRVRQRTQSMVAPNVFPVRQAECREGAWTLLDGTDMLASCHTSVPPIVPTCRECNAVCISVSLWNRDAVVPPAMWEPFAQGPGRTQLSGMGMKRAAAYLLRMRASITTEDDNTFAYLCFRKHQRRDYLYAAHQPSTGVPGGYRVTIDHLPPDAFSSRDLLFLEEPYDRRNLYFAPCILAEDKHRGMRYDRGFLSPHDKMPITHFGANLCLDSREPLDEETMRGVYRELLLHETGIKLRVLERIIELALDEATANCFEVAAVMEQCAHLRTPQSNNVADVIIDHLATKYPLQTHYMTTHHQATYAALLTSLKLVPIPDLVHRVLVSRSRYPSLSALSQEMAAKYNAWPLGLKSDVSDQMSARMRTVVQKVRDADKTLLPIRIRIHQAPPGTSPIARPFYLQIDAQSNVVGLLQQAAAHRPKCCVKNPRCICLFLDFCSFIATALSYDANRERPRRYVRLFTVLQARFLPFCDSLPRLLYLGPAHALSAPEIPPAKRLCV